jgi:hypothetical protein
VYADGLAEVHPMKTVDFRNIGFKRKQLSRVEYADLKSLLTDLATEQLKPQYAAYWGNKDFGYKYDVTIFGPGREQSIDLENFQPFLAREKGKPYPEQVEKLGCAIWKLRAEVSNEPLEKDWLAGCTKLGY